MNRSAMACGILMLHCSIAHAATGFSVPAQSLDRSLDQLAAQAGISILFDPRLVEGIRAPRITGSRSVELALSRLLSSSKLTYRRSASGSIIIARVADAPDPVDDGAIPEILVEGRRTANVDIPRTSDDIQPYRVIGGETIQRSGAQTLDTFLKQRLTANAQALSPIQAPIANTASAASQINLRGLGPDDTLVLVDGHRLPSIPQSLAFPQPNINGIPLEAIERIETLSSTASGIYGPGAIGGVVNIILKHDASSNSITASRGVSERGDAPNWRVHGHLGYESRSGRTQLSFDFEHITSDGINFGDRSFVQSAQATRLAPGNGQSLVPPISSGVNIKSLSGNLIIKTPTGNVTLPSDHTWIPVSAVGAPNMTALMIANAGTYNTSLSPDGNGTEQSLITTSKTNGFVFAAKQDIGSKVEAHLDVVGFQAIGLATGTMLNENKYEGPYEAAGALFTRTTLYTYPTVGQIAHLKTDNRTLRVTGSVLAAIPLGWKAEADLSYGYSDVRSRYPSGDTSFNYVKKLPDLFANPQGFEQALLAWSSPTTRETASDQLLDGNLRLAGPLFMLPGGRATMTVLGELRGEHNPGVTYLVSDPAQQNRAPADGTRQSQSVASTYAEVRLPVLTDAFGFRPLRALELQLSGRFDYTRLAVPVSRQYAYGLNFDDPTGSELTTARGHYATFAFTAGGRVKPFRWLTLRASYATGQLPPTVEQIIPRRVSNGDDYNEDPKRGYEYIADQGSPYISNSGGSSDLKPTRANTLSGGFVVSTTRVRLSLDYTRLERQHEIEAIPDLNFGGFANFEAAVPGAVVRAPLTDADRALGYTGGVILSLNNGLANLGNSTLNAFDVDASYSLPVGSGAIEFSGHATVITSYKSRGASIQPYYELVNRGDGPAKVKANVGVDWKQGPLTAGLNSQIYGSYRFTNGNTGDPSNLTNNTYRVQQQGTDRIPAQAYIDLYLGFSVGHAGQGPRIDYRLTVQNLFDKKPPYFIPSLDTDRNTVITTGIGYSYYGDAIGRRFQASATVHF